MAILASLPLQILFYFNGWYDIVYTVMMLALFAWKGTVLPYSAELRPLLGLEVVLVFVLAIIEYCRLFLGSRGNKTEQAGPLIWSVVLSLPAIAANVYYLHLQIYVTRAELVINAVALAFVGLEILLALLTIVTFIKARPVPSE